ncbi:hypothetical protein D3C86_312610 [compost metagenome]
MYGKGQRGFTIPITMLMVSVLMVLSTAIVAMTIASFKDAARTRNRAEILSVSEIGLKLAVAEIMPGLGTMPYAYWSFAANKTPPYPLTAEELPYASSSVSLTAPATKSGPVTASEPVDLTHEFQIVANVRNWTPFADWTKWRKDRTPAQNLADPEWAKGWWVVPRTDKYDDAYFTQDAHPGADTDYQTKTPSAAHPNPWLYKNPTDDSQLAFPVRLGTSSLPVKNLYWYWLTETEPNTPTNSQIKQSFEEHNVGGTVDPYWVHDRDHLKAGVADTVADRDVGIGAWVNHRDYDDLRDDATINGKKVNYDGGGTSFTFDRDRYNFLNTPVLKKIFLVNHRGKPIRVAVYCRMILREYFLDSSGAKPKRPEDLLMHMRTQTDAGGPNVIFYLVAVNESTESQRGVRVQQAIYVPMGPANPQDLDATNRSGHNKFADNDAKMMPGVLTRLLDKELLAGATLSGQILPASGDFTYRVPHHDPLIDPLQRGQPYTVPNSVDSYHPHWVYLIEWNGAEPSLATFSAPPEATKSAFLTKNTALIWYDTVLRRWTRTPFRRGDTDTPLISVARGSTPSTFVRDEFGRFEIGHETAPAALPDIPVLTGNTPWYGPGMQGWGGQPAGSMSYIVATDLQIVDQTFINARFGRPVPATHSVAPP